MTEEFCLLVTDCNSITSQILSRKGLPLVIKVGDWVSLKSLPSWIEELLKESQAVFGFCIGRKFRVEEIDQHSHLVLDVSPDVDQRFGGYKNDIRVEERYIDIVESK